MRQKNILLDPGHGLFRGVDGQWGYQRDEWWGFREDLATIQFASLVKHHLGKGHGYEIKATRPLLRSAEGMGIGQSLQQRWREGALYWLRSVLDGHPQYKERGRTDRSKDINIRPFYANWLHPACAVGIHMNASTMNSDARGVEVWYPPGRPVSQKLAAEINKRIVQDPKLTVRGIRGDQGWEANHARNIAWLRDVKNEIPVVLVEFLFFTNEADNHLLQDEEVFENAAKAVAKGILAFLGQQEEKACFDICGG